MNRHDRHECKFNTRFVIQCKEKEKKVDRRRGGKTILRSERGWTLLAQLGQLKERDYCSHLWCLKDLTRLWDRLDYMLYCRHSYTCS